MKQQILIVGAGFGGMWSALSAMRLIDQQGQQDIEVTVLAPQAQLRVRPRFYEAQVHGMQAPLGDLFEAVGVNFVQGAAEQIDVAGKRVGYTNANGVKGILSYDRLVLASGSSVVRPNVPGLLEHAFDVDRIEEASRLEAHINALSQLPESAARNTVVVAGGGFTGIETATELPQRLRAALGYDADIKVIVVDRGAQIGAALGESLQPLIAEASASLGVQWRVNSTVASVDAEGITLADGQRIEANTVVWTAGVRASSLTEQIAAKRDNFGRLHVDRNLKVLGQDAIYATGDVAYAATDDLGNYAMMTCQHAIALGRSAGNNVAADLLGVAPIPYSQVKYVTCLDLGAWGAVFTEGWDRQVKYVKEEGKQLKTQINTQWIYPPAANRAEALAAADPLIPVVA
ncbi:FAD-dependent pyridine nucleotide-disulfide oxidoreductase [Pseudomonas sp. CFII64]|uniref:NAD(P)/FAD-dependent oxidoreductase n=1 Tax=Pseudomonas sp. CFII64 TaxID=911242 RepID=UPI000356E163|nr:NAD(P)/FAD-dependent oxidoreductase [Pseudomonas sp. CFII64]EPJ80162.1 FAD-dependent pyridine nucleotide-disulfide oxidoreductase [Pseudomonas sp. CFII64]